MAKTSITTWKDNIQAILITVGYDSSCCIIALLIGPKDIDVEPLIEKLEKERPEDHSKDMINKERYGKVWNKRRKEFEDAQKEWIEEIKNQLYKLGFIEISEYSDIGV